jgi:hypothetical protein
MVESRRTRRIRKIIDAMRRARRQPCMRCGQKIDYDALPEDPNSFNAGHIKSWRNHLELREDPANYQPEHAGCNKHAGVDDAGSEYTGGMQSEEW